MIKTQQKTPAFAFLMFILCVSSGTVFSQGVQTAYHRQKAETVMLQQALTSISEEFGTKFVYEKSLLDGKTTSIDLKNIRNRPVEEVLKEILYPKGLVFLYVKQNYYTIVSKDRLNEDGKKNNQPTNSNNALQVNNSSSNNTALALRNSTDQDYTVQGKVTDNLGKTIPNVNIAVEGSDKEASTNAKGEYLLNGVDKTSTLVFSYIGFTTQRIALDGRTRVDVVLQDDATELDEVVVMGYGTQKKVNLTGAVDVITNKELTNRPTSTVSQLLQGLSPGANFTIDNQEGFQPGATMGITIRGMGSLNGGSPYILIDGFPGDINNLNPEDVESISVLKDAAASAIYGARAPYGVILVTTKRGKKNEKMSVSYSVNAAINTPQSLPESLDSYTWSRIQNEAGDNSGGHPISNETIDQIIAYQHEDWDYLRQFMPEGATHFGAFPEGNVWNNANLNYANTDWWDVYFGHSVNQTHNLAVQGGAKKVSYYFSAGYVEQNGVLNYGTDKFQRMNMMGKVDVSITDWWNFSWESRLSKKDREKPNMTKEGDYSFMYRHISRAYPITPIYDGWGYPMFESHIPSIESGSDKTDDYDYWNNFKTEIRPLKGWKINADFAYNSYSSVRADMEKLIYIHNVDKSASPNGVSIPNNLERTLNNNHYWTSNIYSSYNLAINNRHNFTLLAGMQFERGKNTRLVGYKTDIISEDVPSLQTATGSAILTEALSHRATQGYFSRFTYNYKEKYLLETNARYDGSYVFREGKRWGFFPSFSLGWNVDKEPFWTTIEPYVNTLKFRASWGQLGNQQVSPYSDLELIPLQSGKLNWLFNYGETRPIGYTTAPGIVNRNLTWETATTKNIGVDMSFLTNRLEAKLDLFERLTTNMIGPSEAKPGVLGASVPQDNNSSLRTRGWELSLNWSQNFESGFSYFINANLYDYQSVVTKYFNPTGTLSTWYEGREVGDIWGYTVHDLFRTQEELDQYLGAVDLSQLASNWRTGDVKYEDTNNDNKVNNGKSTIDDHGDLSIIGNDNPHYQYGITVGMNIKNFDFSMLWRGVAKKDMYFSRMSNIFWGFTNGWWESTLQPRNLDYFRDTPGTPYSGLYEGDENINIDAYWPRPYLNSTEEAKNKNNPNTRYLQDASYIRLQNVQLGYSLPQHIVSKLNLQRIRIYFSGENLLTFTKLPDGIDPVAPVGFAEGGSGDYYGTAGSGRLTYGADRIYSFGLSATF